MELELELNEVRYTDADFVEQAKLEKMNAKAKDAIFIQFENIEQDQTPKYNKMHAALSAQPSAWIYNNLMYLLLGCISMCAITLLIKNASRCANI